MSAPSGGGLRHGPLCAGSEDVCTGPSTESILSKAKGLRTGSGGGEVDRGADFLYNGSGLGLALSVIDSDEGDISETVRIESSCEICQNKKGTRAMAKEITNKSIVDQMMEVWFAELESTKEFDVSTIERLKHLASRGTLKKPAQVTKAVKVVSKVQNETH